MKTRKCIAVVTVTIMVALIFVLSCSEDNKEDTGPQKYSVGGNVEGLTGSGLVLQNNGNDNLPLSENGSFTFPEKLTDSSTYNVTILSYPDGQTCYIENGSGTVTKQNVTDVMVICETPPAGGNCSGGSVSYFHDLANDYAGFHQEITASGVVPFTCDDEGNITGSGVLIATVTGNITAPCLLSEFSGMSNINVTITGTYSLAQVLIESSEVWYAGSPMASGTATNTCNAEVQPFNYPLIETLLEHTIPFPTIDGYRIEQPYIGEGGSGYYSWTLTIE